MLRLPDPSTGSRVIHTRPSDSESADVNKCGHVVPVCRRAGSETSIAPLMVDPGVPPLSFGFNTECRPTLRVGCRAEVAVVARSRDHPALGGGCRAPYTPYTRPHTAHEIAPACATQSHPSLTCWPQNVLPRTDYRANGPLVSGQHGI
jgi:hypothetical protein